MDDPNFGHLLPESYGDKDLKQNKISAIFIGFYSIFKFKMNFSILITI